MAVALIASGGHSRQHSIMYEEVSFLMFYLAQTELLQVCYLLSANIFTRFDGITTLIISKKNAKRTAVVLGETIVTNCDYTFIKTSNRQYIRILRIFSELVSEKKNHGKKFVLGMASGKLHGTLNLSKEAEEVRSTIVTALERSNKNTAEDLLETCFGTLEKLVETQKLEKVPYLLEILSFYSAHINHSERVERLVSMVLPNCTHPLITFIQKVFENEKSGESRSKIIQMLQPYKRIPEVESFCKRLEKKLGKLSVACAEYSASQSNSSSLHQQNSCEALIERFSCKEKPNGSEILKLLRSKETLTVEEIRDVTSLLSNETESLFEILRLVYKHYARYSAIRAASGECAEPFPLTSTVLDITTSVVMDPVRDEKTLRDFVALLGNMLVPGFVPMIKALNDDFIQEGRFSGLLKNILSYVGYETLIKIVAPVDIVKHAFILKNVYNADISHFLLLYERYADNQKMLESVLSLLPGFCSYCTDKNGSIDLLLELMKRHLGVYRSVVCNSLERLVRTHHTNLVERLVLPTKIDRKTSETILARVSGSGIAQDIIQQFLNATNNECDLAISALVDFCGFDMSKELTDALMDPVRSTIPTHKVLSLLTFFAKNVDWSSYDRVCALISLCSSAEASTRKKAYQVLEAAVGRGFSFCVCKLLFTKQLVEIENAILRERLSFLLCYFRRGCSECDTSSFSSKVFSELVAGVVVGNCKCKKFAENTVRELASNPYFRSFLLESLACEPKDKSVVAGVILAVSTLVEHINSNLLYIEEAHSEADDIQFVHHAFSLISAVCFSSTELIKPTIVLISTLLTMKKYRDLHNEMVDLLSKFVKGSGKKYARELKECASKAKKSGCKLSSELHLVTRFKNKGGKEAEIQVMKNK